jgi:general secretion pathway protein M
MRQLPSSRVAWLQVLTVLLLVLPLVAAAFFVITHHASVLKHIESLEPRYARLLGLSERQAEFQTLGLQAGEQLKRLAYPASQDATQAGNDAQQRIRALFADSKLEISSIQVLPSREAGLFDRIPIDLRVEGDLTGIQNALALLSAQSPVVLTEEITLQTIGAVKPASIQRLSGQFIFSVFRARP